MSGLPGYRHALQKGSMCDRHPDRTAVANVQGETDSFGYETNLVCQECLDADRAYERSAEARTGRCDWCSQIATDLRWARDYDEGMHGPTYRVCGACGERQEKQAREELERWDDRYGSLYDEPDDDDFDDWLDLEPGSKRDESVSDGSGAAGETKGLDPKDDSAAGNAGTPDPSPLYPHAEGNGHG